MCERTQTIESEGDTSGKELWRSFFSAKFSTEGSHGSTLTWRLCQLLHSGRGKRGNETCAGLAHYIKPGVQNTKVPGHLTSSLCF